MPEYVIVTVKFANRGFETDTEIPSELTFDVVKQKLLDLLRRSSHRYLQNCRDLSISFNDRNVSYYETPAQIGAFDGSKLIVNAIA